MRPFRHFAATVLVFTAFAAEAKEPPRTVRVDCNKGQTIGDALAKPAEVLVIEFSGTCAEDVVIGRDDVALAGVTQAAAITGVADGLRAAALSIRGAQRVTLRQFTVRDGDGRGIELRDGATVALDSLAAEGNQSAGLIVLTGSFAFVRNSRFDDNGNDGVGVWNNSALQFEGSVQARRNGRVGFLASGASDLSVALAGAEIVASDNSSSGFHLQLGASAQIGSAGGAHMVAERNAVGLSLLQASFGGAQSIVIRDSPTGISMLASNTELNNLDVSGCPQSGVFANFDSVVMLNSSRITGNQRGVVLDASTAEVRQSTITGNTSADVHILFGSRASFLPNNTVGNVVCDPTALVRGSASCTGSAVAFAARATGEQAIRAGSEQITEEVRALPLLP